MDKFISRKEALKILGIHYHTLYKLVENEELESITIGNKNFYNISGYLKEKGINLDKKIKKNICYCRVSSQKQKEDLERQIEYMKKEYPYHEIITDIASGLNYERPGLKKILKYATDGLIEELVIAYKDRLTRFGFEMIEWLIKEKSNGRIKILNNNEEMTPTEEIAKDIISIMNIYTAKVNGLRKYKKQIKEDLIKG